MRKVSAGGLMAESRSSVDPSRSPDETFELWSIPAFDRGGPDVVAGRDIGSQKQAVRPGDVLLSKIVPHIRRAWVVGPQRGLRQIASSEWIVFRSPDAEPSYLRHLLVSEHFHREFMATVSGVGGSLLRARPSHVAKIEVPLPPIEEQRRIAAILDKADELRAKRREALAHLDSLVQSIFLDMFGDPVVNSAGWPDRRVDGALAFLTYGHRFYDESYSESGTPVVRITDLNEAGDLDFSSMPRMALTEDERKAYSVNVGDLLFARSGATVGKVALVRTGDPECIAGAYFVWLRFGDEVHPEYARAVLTSARVRTMIAKQSRQAAQQNFSGPAIKRLPMPVPPAQLQAEFAVAVERVRTQTARHQQAGRDLDALFASLQQQAFSGAL